jgi:hypothetical protein
MGIEGGKASHKHFRISLSDLKKILTVSEYPFFKIVLSRSDNGGYQWNSY